MTKQEAEALVKKHGSRNKVCAALKMSKNTLRKVLGGASVATTTVQKSGRSIAEFQNTYDKSTIIPAKVKSALAELGHSWEYENEFVKRSGVSFTDLGNARSLFVNNWLLIKSDGKRVWSSKETIKKMKEML